jgi:hypothetical protein
MGSPVDWLVVLGWRGYFELFGGTMVAFVAVMFRVVRQGYRITAA